MKVLNPREYLIIFKNTILFHNQAYKWVIQFKIDKSVLKMRISKNLMMMLCRTDECVPSAW